MKKTYKAIIALVSLACAALTACNDDYNEVVGDGYTMLSAYYNLSTEMETMTFSSDGSTLMTNHIHAEGTGWRITPAAPWVHITPTQGSPNAIEGDNYFTAVTFSTDEYNEAGDTRMAVNTLESTASEWHYTLPVTVVQYPAAPYMEAVGETSFTVPGKGGVVAISFNTNDNWNMTCTAGTASWFKTAENQGFGSRSELLLTIQPNDQGVVRSTTVWVTSATNSNQEATFHITQLASNIDVEGTGEVVIDNKATQLTFKVNADAPWTAQLSPAEVSWLTMSPMSGEAGETTVMLTATDNMSIDARQCSVGFFIGNEQKNSMTVVQRGLYLSVAGVENENPFTVRLDSRATTATVTVESNTDWKAETDPASDADWLTVSPASAQGNGKLMLTCQENPNTLGRSARVHVYVGQSYATAIVKREMTVVQNGKSISLDRNTLNFDDDAATQQVQITAEGPWTATTESDWIALAPQSGSGNATLAVSVGENRDEADRTGLVAVTMADKTLNLTVVQRGKMMMLNDAPLLFGSTGGSADIYIYTNDTWTATVDDSPGWIQLSPTSGEDSAHVQVTVLSNNYLSPRQATVNIASGSGRKYGISVQQAMRYLRANASSFTFLGEGGQQGPLIIESDGQYTVKSSAAWLSLAADPVSGGYLLTALQNSGQKQRTDTIVVACTDLLEGTLELKIPVRQVSNTTDLSLSGYSVDGNWNVSSAGGFTITITGYKTDQDWNPTGGQTEPFTVNRRGYETDKDWNPTGTDGDASSMNRRGFGADQNWNK